MNSDGGLVHALIERLTSRLPHRTGSTVLDHLQDNIAQATRATIIKVSLNSNEAIIERIATLLVDLGRSYKSYRTHPPHILLSEVYLIALMADCCRYQWTRIREVSSDKDPMPQPVGMATVGKWGDYLKVFLEPVADSDGFLLPARTILDDAAAAYLFSSRFEDKVLLDTSSIVSEEEFMETSRETLIRETEPHIAAVHEFLVAANWADAFGYLRALILGVRNLAPVHVAAPTPSIASIEEERQALVLLRLMANGWVDAFQLSMCIQELGSSFLHFRKSFQNTLAVVTPLLIRRWADRYPYQLVRLHQQGKRLDGGPDTLFDMTVTIGDNNLRKMMLYPMQAMLLLLIPEVFEAAISLREAKTGGLARKVAFLEGMRKAARNGNDSAGYALVCLLRAARHFDTARETSVVTYALDIQDDIRDVVFRRHGSSSPAIGGLYDQELTTTTFIALTQINAESAIEPLCQACLHPTAPHSFRIAIIQASTYFSQQPEVHRYSGLFQAVIPFARDQLYALYQMTKDMYLGDPAAQRKAYELAPSTTIICHIFRLLLVWPQHLFPNEPPKTLGDAKQDQVAIYGLIGGLVSPHDDVRNLAFQLALPNLGRWIDLIKDVLWKNENPRECLSRSTQVWSLMSHVLLDMCERRTRVRPEMFFRSIRSYVKSRKLFMSVMDSRFEIPKAKEMPEVIASTDALETILLVGLCSPDLDICQLVTSCISEFSEECRLIDAKPELDKGILPLLRNVDVYREIGLPSFRFTGIVAFQKRFRVLLRRMRYPSVGILNAWETAFGRWIHLCKDVSTATLDSVDDRTLSEWRNLSGFLACLGGICTADYAINVDELTVGGLRWIDRLSSENYEETLLNRYLRLSIQLLACSNIRVRETMREVLANEMAPSLSMLLIKTLAMELEVLFTGALETAGKGQDAEIIFAEQAASLLKALVERFESPNDINAASSVHLAALALDFAKFLDDLDDSPACLRVKIKICQLCETKSKKKELLNLRDDVRIRNQMIEYVFRWIGRASSPRLEYMHPKHDEIARLQRDLDQACLRALAELTYRLPLQPAEGYNDAGATELKSQMFLNYFNHFLSLLNTDSLDSASDIMAPSVRGNDTVSTPDLAVTILSNLLSANIDVGLKHSLSIGAHENLEIRHAFVRVLYNILVQGSEFSHLTDAAVSEKYNEMLELLTQNMTLCVAVSSVCPSSEVDELTVSLLNIFERRGLHFELMEVLIKAEIAETETESEVLRRNCVATKMLSVYARWNGAAYLRATLQKVVERLMLTSKDLDLELDPARIESPEIVQKNALRLRHVAKIFIDDICASSANIPNSFRKICSIISNAVMPRFPEAKYTAVGAFIFLRFFCPAIVAPEADCLTSETPGREMRRGLLLIAKVIQNLANNVLFGAKEPYMYPLNDFLTQNIYRVTTFLREISVPPETMNNRSAEGELFDFGSCVALHRFIYEHWDSVRQKLLCNEKKGHMRSPDSSSRGHCAIYEPLRSLISNVGPPPLAITWNRPSLALNNPLTYSRFQHFMLRNTFRHVDSFTMSRVVYDGGETKDGIAIICLILRNIDWLALDFGDLLYYYFKIASRLWQKPLGLLIDATNCSPQNDHHENLLLNLDVLSPAEHSANFKRVYIYNVNSTYRKLYRRIFRQLVKQEKSLFSPTQVQHHLLGSLAELQSHFDLSQLHLPKETMSVLSDMKYVFQPVARLSKTKGKIEVTVKIGSQWIQVTTIKKQEINTSFRLSSTVNDVFKLGEVEEAPNTDDDDSTFGLRTDNGRIVMYFQSPKKLEILSTIRAAKARYSKDTRSIKSFDRMIRPQDVPGALLNIALANMASCDPGLRTSSYNLLAALCHTFKFKAAARLKCINDIEVPVNPSEFVINMSTDLAREEPQLTIDFLNEFLTSWGQFSAEQKPLSLIYMAPWLPSLRTASLGEDSDGEKGREKIACIFRKLLDISIGDPSLTMTFSRSVWPCIYQDEALLDILFEEILRAALSLELNHEHIASLTSIISAISTVTLRGKVISRLRKTLNRSSLRPTRSLPENAIWGEICVLLIFCLAMSFDCGIQSQLYFPEIFHIITMLANTGSIYVQGLVHRLLINTLHAACTSFKLNDGKQGRLKGALEILAEPKNEMFYNTTPVRDVSSYSTTLEGSQFLLPTENLAAMLFEICAIAGPSIDMTNAWRSRWMGLVASTAFQTNPAIQPRAFAVMGCLAREEVDDDLLYQVLVALRSTISRHSEDVSTELTVAIITSLSKMMGKLMTASRYGLQLFWLAMAFVRMMPPSTFNCAASFLESVLANIGGSNELRSKMASILMQGRAPLETAATSLDDTCGVHFDVDNFHIAVSASLIRGLTANSTKPTTLRVLSALLEMQNLDFTSEVLPPEVLTSPYLILIQARVVEQVELKDALWLAGINPAKVFTGSEQSFPDFSQMKDRDILVISAIQMIDFQYLDDAVQTRMLAWLNNLALFRPSVIVLLCPPIVQILDDVLLHCQNTDTLEAAYQLQQTILANQKFLTALNATSTLNELLEDMGFGGLWRSCSYKPRDGEMDRQHCVMLTDKLIELIIA